MNKTIRINTTLGGDDKYLKINLNQSFDHLEILSLKLTQDQVYRKFSADYGVVVGRVIANRGFGVPNARISVFIPLDENESNEDIIGRYPYQSVFDTNNQGIRYNLLEDSIQSSCHTIVGTFPNKRKLLDNNIWLEIYEKYYKFTTVTNQSGDYMLVGVPLGAQIIHMDVDLSDIGFVSIKPYDLIAQGYSENLFEDKTKFKGGTDLDSLVQLQSRNVATNIRPFWGDSNENDVGINRVDIALGADITPTALFFGSMFTDSRKSFTNLGCKPQARTGKNCDLSTGKGQVEYIRRVSRSNQLVEYISNNTTKIDDDGAYSFAVPMNLDTVITDEFGNLIPSQDPTIGIPTRALVRFRLSLDEFRFGFRRRTAHFLVPNMYNRFNFDDTTQDDDMFEMHWKGVYTTGQYIARYQKDNILGDESKFFIGIKNIGECENTASFPYNRINVDFNPLYNILCVLIRVVGSIINIINDILTTIVFGVVLKFVCFVKHPFDANMRSACRCQACLNLTRGVSGDQNMIPFDWDGSLDINSNSEDDRYECAECYDADGDGATGTTVTGSTVDCSGFTYSLCSGLCQTCDVSFIKLQCNEDFFPDGNEWAECISENLAEQLGVIQYEFYNDWVVGSLYSPLFQYKIRFRKKGKNIERFCDLDCRDPAIPPSSIPDDPHRKNVCRNAYIADRKEFNDGVNWEIEEINPPDGRGLFVEYDDYLYYASRHDVESNPNVVSDLTVLQKDQLLLATNIVDLGSSVSCDIENRPFLIDSLEASSYQKDEGTQTLFNVSNCLSAASNINRNGITLESQIGIDILVAESQEISPTTIIGDDGEVYSIVGNEINFPDYDNNVGILILDRDDVILRKYLCENFNYYAVNGVYSSINNPVGGDYLQDSDGDIVEFVSDSCVGFDDFVVPAQRIHPYYMYFGIRQGVTSLDKLKENYFKNCVE